VRICAIAISLALAACISISESLHAQEGPVLIPMAPTSEGEVPLTVTADGSYRWSLDGADRGKITASQSENVKVSVTRHEIRASSLDGRLKFYRVVTVAAGKEYSVMIAGKPVPSAPAANTPARTNPTNAVIPASPVPPALPKAQALDPDMFVKITAGASGTVIRVLAVPPSMETYYDIKVQVVMKDVGNGDETIALPDLQPWPMNPHAYTVAASQLGKEAVICYTARPPQEQEAKRWTGTFTIQPGATGPARAAFVPAHEPTLEPASNAPCGGLNAVKAEPASSPELPAASDATTPVHDSTEAALALVQGSRLFNAKRYLEAEPLLAEACDNGSSLNACNSVGQMYEYHLGVPTDFEKARTYYAKACNDNSTLSCANLGGIYDLGEGVSVDKTKALELFQRACDSGILEGCTAAGMLHLDPPPGATRDNALALALFKQACDGSYALGCRGEALVYIMGAGVPVDMPFAISLDEKSCELGDPGGCHDLGDIYQGVNGVRRDLSKSKQYYSKACNLGDQKSCGSAY
jgi:uncharacterized protein